MKLTHWSHARVRMRERNITEAEVEAVLVNPDDLPAREEIAALLVQHHLKVYA